MISVLIVCVVTTGALSRVTEFNFEDAEVEDIYMTGCHSGYITNEDHTCTRCTLGTFANTTATPQSCDHCPYNSYSGSEGATECVRCGDGFGTLEEGSTSGSDCVAVCEIPEMNHVVRTTPESRVEEGGEVMIDCVEGYHYGNKGRAPVRCSSTVNNFPESCRRLNISTSGPPSIVTGETAQITCTIEARGADYEVQWYKDTISYLVNVQNRSKYSVVTTSEKQRFESTVVQTSVLRIFNFSNEDVALYSCGARYEDHLRNDHSPKLFLNELLVVMTPAETQILTTTQSLTLTCVMSLDHNFDSRYITWQHHTRYDVSNMDITPTTKTTTVYTNDTHHYSLLHLTDVTIHSAGTYTCSASYTKGMGDRVVQSRSVEVRVRGVEITPEYQVVEVGAELQLSCVVEGDQRASIEWITPGKTPTELNITSDVRDEYPYLNDMWKTTSVASLYPVKPNQGTNGSYSYQCQASFGLGDEETMRVKSAVATVVVRDFGIVEDPTNQTVYVGERTKLSCVVKSSDVHPAAVRWRKSSNPDIIDDTKINFRRHESLGRSTSILTLRSVAEEDGGEYFCEVVYVVDGKFLVRESNAATLHVKTCKDQKKKCHNLSKEGKKKLKKMCRKSSWQESCPKTCGVC
ncbi:hypothetical protein ACHWQZ_G016625 [Mnemiopsis leidyi]